MSANFPCLITEREAQLADRRTDCRRGFRQFLDFARRAARRDLGVSREVGELARRELLAEEERGGGGKLVRFVEDDRVACRQELGQAFVAQHHVGEEQVVVHHDDVGLERVLARLQHEAFAMMRAIAAEAVLARRRDERPDRCILRHVGELTAIAGFAGARESDDLRQMTRVVA
jgi:hypothetical protein